MLSSADSVRVHHTFLASVSTFRSILGLSVGLKRRMTGSRRKVQLEVSSQVSGSRRTMNANLGNKQTAASFRFSNLLSTNVHSLPGDMALGPRIRFPAKMSNPRDTDQIPHEISLAGLGQLLSNVQRSEGIGGRDQHVP